ncbi:MAG TPA: hypothetical protein VJ953_17530 [Saprospiraceae bacterium]|nr:hypothetical protein [Saprospiraceae bacterium]
MHQIDFITIVRYAWLAYDPSRSIKTISDISAQVSTNHVYKIVFEDKSFVIAKLSYFGKYEHFVEDHTIINVMANNLPSPFENFLARSLMRGNQLFVHRFTNDLIDTWIVFYNAVKIKKRLPRRLEEKHIVKLGQEFARFHKTCDNIKNPLPKSTKTLRSDLHHLQEILDTEMGRFMHGRNEEVIRSQIDTFLENQEAMGALDFPKIPVFVDWNIGNFSVTNAGKLYTRWDYDWFRISSRILDFYFLSRIVSDIGDRTVFSYNADTMMEDRFILFLKEYHAVYPLSENEIRFLKEAYRFFILNYVIKDGRYFFHEIYAIKLQKEAYESYFPRIDKDFDAEKLLKALDI